MKQENYKKIAKDVVLKEVIALKRLNKSFDKSFLKALEIISKCRGKLVLAGIGKSGLISRKISATLSSTGTPSFYLHPSEASHGDLGQITKEDVLLIFSYSGETEELKNIIGYANRFAIQMIGVASKKNSLLLRSSNVKIVLPEVKEAGVGGFLPTASTTVMLAFGDALAVALMHKKKFNRDKFKLFHPSGSLGKILTTVQDLMVKGRNIPVVSENKKMKEAIKIMTKKKLGCLVAIDKKKFVSGFVSDGDLRRKSSKNLFKKRIKDVMTKKPLYVGEDMLALKALNIMNKNKITTLLISNNKEFQKKRSKFKLKGLLHIHTLLKKGIN